MLRTILSTISFADRLDLVGALHPFYGPMGAAGQVTDDEGYANPGNVSPLDGPVPDTLEQADTRRPHRPPIASGIKGVRYRECGRCSCKQLATPGKNGPPQFRAVSSVTAEASENASPVRHSDSSNVTPFYIPLPMNVRLHVPS